MDFKFVLLGHLQSDPIESRFGWLRQMAGGNYFISVRQIVDSDAKIRMMSLLKHSKLSLSDIDDFIDDIKEPSSTLDEKATNIANLLTSFSVPCDSEATTIYYVAGAVAHSIIYQNKCPHCKELLVDDDFLHLDDLKLDRLDIYLNKVDRGGLLKPSEYAFTTCLSNWKVFESLKKSEFALKSLISSTNQRALFIKIVERLLVDESLLVEENFCICNHNIKELISCKFFNCIFKNYIRQFNERVTENNSNKRKLNKITK